MQTNTYRKLCTYFGDGREHVIMRPFVYLGQIIQYRTQIFQRNDAGGETRLTK
jgi:hypothetical protein